MCRVQGYCWEESIVLGQVTVIISNRRLLSSKDKSIIDHEPGNDRSFYCMKDAMPFSNSRVHWSLLLSADLRFEAVVGPSGRSICAINAKPSYCM